ncbi:MAG: nucleotidyl transferase AbiEii/AbiGii toxin family protein [Candidatus Omnitrophota bacterium]
MSRLFDPLAHRRYLSLLLVGLAKAFPGKIAFKGGTCAYFFYDLPRFSFDLDFDMIQEFSAGDVDLFRELIARQGQARDFWDKRNTLFCLFDYGKGQPNIKIELNRRVWEHNTYKPVWYLGVPISTADESTLLTNKLVALTDRKSAVARDLYDSWYFLKAGFPIREALVMERTGGGLSVYLETAIRFIKKTFTARNVLHGLGDALDEKQKSWAKTHLVSETIREIEKRLKDGER